MTKYSLADIKIIVDELALKINAPTNLLPNYGQENCFAQPYIEIIKDNHHLSILSLFIVSKSTSFGITPNNDSIRAILSIFALVSFAVGLPFFVITMSWLSAIATYLPILVFSSVRDTCMVQIFPFRMICHVLFHNSKKDSFCQFNRSFFVAQSRCL